ncbi:M23 family metallopeptidase [Peribacillus tepidiphilus]|uniref:M23 family metallopeptidase n=1 Tax=Peribacillus tepidiphilus TaxID=2652445 RepID=UPI00129152F7|nr:M23 family metallopeptidase [Peribacillus tepidiphilus]
MKDRRKEIRNRIANRKKIKDKKPRDWNYLHDEERYDHHLFSGGGSASEASHPLFKKEMFLLKILAAMLLFVSTAVMFKHPSEKLEPIREFLQNTMEQELQFAAITDWYEKKFGKPIAFLPNTAEKETTEASNDDSQYDVPASGKILQNFETNGEGIMIETGKDSNVEAINEGIVIFAGVKDHIGKTIIIQHSDKTESWYANLQQINVKLYDFVEKKQELGVVSISKDGTKGEFYFAIKSNETFIDPNQVISFD